MENDKCQAIDSIYEIDLEDSILEDLLKEKKDLQERMLVIEKEIQNNIILNKEVMLNAGFKPIETIESIALYYKGKYRFLISYNTPYSVKVFDSINPEPFEFSINSRDDFYNLLTLLCLN